MNKIFMNNHPDNNQLALDRTVLANDRTYQAWIRTGLALFASGLGAARFMKDDMALWVLLFVTSLLLVLSALAFLQAAWRYRHMNVRFSTLDVDTRPTWAIQLISILLASMSLLSLAAILVFIYLGN